MNEQDDWQPVGEDDWKPVGGGDRAGDLVRGVPRAFMDRVVKGEAIRRIIDKGVAGAKEGYGEPTPTGFSNETFQQLIDVGVFHDPAKGRPSPIQFSNEAFMMPLAKGWAALTGGLNAGIHTVGGIAGQIAEELGESQGMSERLRREVINFGNFAMIEGGMGTFSRPKVGPMGPQDQVIGTLPREADFRTGAQVLGGEATEANLRRAWQEDGIHPAEAVHDAQTDAFVKHDMTREPKPFKLDPIDEEVLTETGGRPGNLSAAAGEPPIDIPLSRQPAQPPGTLMTAAHKAADTLLDIGRDAQMLVAPMARGTPEAQAIAKDFANTVRRNRWEWSRIDDDIAKTFTSEQRTRMWNAADEESVAIQLGESREHQGLVTLEPAERAAVDQLQARAQIAWLRARDLGMVEGEGLPAYTPRMVMNAILADDTKGPIPINGLGLNLRSSTPNLRQRMHMTVEETEAAAKAKYGNDAYVARDIRALPLATGQLEDAIAGRTLINNIKDYGKRTGAETVVEGAIPAGSDKWFTIDHPAFRTLKKETKSIDIPSQKTTATVTHEMGIDPGLQTGLERVASALGVDIRQPLRQQDPVLRQNPNTLGYTSRAGSDVVSTFGNAQTVLEHELGHKIDFRYGLSHEIKKQSLAAWQELGELALHRVAGGQRDAIRSQPDFLKKLSSHENYSGRVSAFDDYLLSAEERVANLLHAYWYSPKLLQSVAPNASRWFNNFLSEAPDALKTAIKSVEPSLRSEMRRVGEDISVMSNPVNLSVDSFKQVPIYVHGDFEGPLRAVLTQRSGQLYGAMMSLKGKTMSLIMNSPMIHNAVEWGRAMPAMPGKVATFKVYFEGNRVKNDVVQMREAIDAGLVPIGKRFFNQDITSIMEAPDLAPGRSWTAKVLGAVPGLFDEAAGNAVKAAIDKAGDFWHNTLLWDRIADLQAGLYSNFRDDMVAKGIDRQTSARVAAHWANRYAGALPQEAMSDAARKVSNMLLFSRSFTMGNLGVMKDMMTGLPKDVIAQIERDAGFGRGAIEAAEPGVEAAAAVKYAKTLARRKAWSVVMMDVGLMYVGNSILQSVLNVIRTDRTADQEMRGYADRFADAMQNVKEHPLALLQPFDFMQRVSSTYENEPGKQDRVRVGTAKDGTAVYMRNPVGKIGEEFVGYMTGPLDMMHRKLGTIARPVWQILSNDKGFGRKVYDPNADTPAKYVANIGRIAAHLAVSQVPEGQITAAMDMVKGDGDSTVNAAQAFGPIAGLTFSKGAPGGPAVGEAYKAREMHDFQVQRDLPDIRKQVQRGDIAGAQERLSALGVPPGLQRFYIKTSLFPETRLGGRTLRDFYLYATPEQRQRLERARGGGAGALPE